MSTNESDLDLLQQYLQQGSQAAFAALVRRHLDLVYSAARRQVRSPQLAEEVAQSVFFDLSRHTATLKPGLPLTAWLYLVTRRTAIDVIRRESRRQAREQVAYEIAAMNSSPPAWPQVEPLLDEAMEALDDTDRSAVLLRYFENQSLREVGHTLGTSEDAAQKRVSRALDQLRTFFLKRGVTISATVLATDLSAHAIQTAPGALSFSISTATAMGAGASQVAALETSKTIALTTLQKSALTATLALVAGGAVFETNRLWHQRDELAAALQRNDDLSAQIRRAQNQQSDLARQLTAARQRQTDAGAGLTVANPPLDPAITATMQALVARFERLREIAGAQPELTLPELGLLSEQDWFNAAQQAKSDSDDDLRRTLATLRHNAKLRCGALLGFAVRNYIQTHQGLLPSDLRELIPYFPAPGGDFVRMPDEAVLPRYTLLYSGPVADIPMEERNRIVVETTSIDEEADSRVEVGVSGGAGSGNFRDLSPDVRFALNAFTRANGGASPKEASQLLPYFKPVLSAARQQKFLQTGSQLLSP